MSTNSVFAVVMWPASFQAYLQVARGNDSNDDNSDDAPYKKYPRWNMNI